MKRAEDFETVHTVDLETNKKYTRFICVNTKNSAITLIALIITIIVLLILAGVTLNMVMGDSGVFRKASKASENTNFSQAKEFVELKILEYKAKEISENKIATLEGVKEFYKSNSEIEISLLKGLEPAEDVKEADRAKIKLKNYKYIFIIDETLNIIDSESSKEDEEIVKPKVNARYLLIDVNGYHAAESAVINEISVYNSNNEKINYNILSNLEYDNVCNGQSFYWERNFWNYTNLNDNEIVYSSNIEGAYNCTIFLYDEINYNSQNINLWARFIIDLGENYELNEIRFNLGGPEGRMPMKISVYSVDNFIDGAVENSTYSKNVCQRINDGLSLISEKTFETILNEPEWINFLENKSNSIKSRYILFDINGYISGDSACINELSIFNKFNEKVNYRVLNNLEYDNVCNGQSFYWERNFWNYTNLNDNEIEYTSNYVGRYNCTLWLYNEVNYNPDPNNESLWARFIIDLNCKEYIDDIEVYLGGPEGRMPMKISAYNINNFIDGTQENTTYNLNILQRSNDGLTLLSERNFTDEINEPTKYSLLKNNNK